jgi:hypothetical protein
VWTSFDKTTNITINGEHVVEVEVLDGAGNAARSNHLVRVDANSPAVAINVTGTKGNGAWFTSPVTLTAQVTEQGSGVSALRYRVGDGAWGEFQNPLVLDHAGTQRVTVAVVDGAGNPSDSASVVVAIDQEPPVPPLVRWQANPDGRVEAAWLGTGPVDLVSGVEQVAVEQGASGAVQRKFAVSAQAANLTIGPFQTGTHEFRVAVTDAAGNTAVTPWATVEVTESVGGLASIVDGKVVRGVATLEYTPLVDFDEVEVIFYVDGELRRAVAEAPYEYVWDTRVEEDGLHEVRVVARDASGATFEETTTYEVRNSYAHVVEDLWVPVAAAAAAGLLSIVLAVAGAIQWRRWEIA